MTTAEKTQLVGAPVTFEVGRRTLHGTISTLVANDTKCAIDTTGGEYVLPLEYVQRVI